MMWSVREKLREHGWLGVLRDYVREVKVAHLLLLQDRDVMREALADSASAPVTRRGARKRPVVRARLVQASDDLGATDSSKNVARITTADDVPLDAVKSDLKRKIALRSVMPQPDGESEGLNDEILGDDNDDDEERGECHDSMGFVVDCDHPDAVDAHRLSERDPRRPTGSLGMRPLGDSSDEEPEPGSGQVSKETVNYRYDSTQRQQCRDCVNFRAPSACRLVAGLIRATDTCDFFAPARKPNRPSEF